MALAIAVTPRQEVAGHFGKAATFKVYDEQGRWLADLENSGSKAVGCKHKKLIQRQLAEQGVSTIILGNVGQRSLARLLNAGFVIFRVPSRSALTDVLNGTVPREALTAAEQGRPCKREKGGCGCGCGTKKAAPAPVAKIGTRTLGASVLKGLTKIGGLKL
ncbi:hypothetical protein L4C36_13710 [Photobacterium japonica]|uniref:NifB/NifX family molybdenum-iron cluster-binding protein n=1 Tax=Photobacterium japonica TaxID=2910235 RepID=UPI003D12138C